MTHKTYKTRLCISGFPNPDSISPISPLGKHVKAPRPAWDAWCHEPSIVFLCFNSVRRQQLSRNPCCFRFDFASGAAAVPCPEALKSRIHATELLRDAIDHGTQELTLPASGPASSNGGSCQGAQPSSDGTGEALPVFEPGGCSQSRCECCSGCLRHGCREGGHLKDDVHGPMDR